LGSELKEKVEKKEAAMRTAKRDSVGEGLVEVA
jgi:hypothetical protein